jgi:malonyl-CoA O-methyltransferase
MDDRIFDDETALQWISAIEYVKNSTRDLDIHPEVQAWVKKNSLTEILEIGSGQGICSDKINLDNRRYTGVESSPKMTERAKKLYSRENRSFVLGNVYSLPFATEVFDGAFSILVWHLLSDLETAARELARVLKSGGHFLIVTANPEAYSAWKAFYNDFQLDENVLRGQ